MQGPFEDGPFCTALAISNESGLGFGDSYGREEGYLRLLPLCMAAEKPALFSTHSTDQDPLSSRCDSIVRHVLASDRALALAMGAMNGRHEISFQIT